MKTTGRDQKQSPPTSSGDKSLEPSGLTSRPSPYTRRENKFLPTPRERFYMHLPLKGKNPQVQEKCDCNGEKTIAW